MPQPTTGRIRQGFTLVEMLIVIGIIAVLIGLLLPGVSRARFEAERKRMAMDIQSLATGLEAYRQDHGDYPRVPPPVNGVGQGAVTLCRAVIAPEPAVSTSGTGFDGADGPGFRTRVAVNGVQQSKVYGPYVNPDQFTVNMSLLTIVDRSGKSILYYYANKVNLKQSKLIAEDANYTVQPGNLLPRYNISDNSPDLKQPTLSLLLGDADKDGQINGTESATTNAPYLVISSGPDGQFGPTKSPTLPINSSNPCDDVANFPLPGY